MSWASCPAGATPWGACASPSSCCWTLFRWACLGGWLGLGMVAQLPVGLGRRHGSRQRPSHCPAPRPEPAHTSHQLPGRRRLMPTRWRSSWAACRSCSRHVQQPGPLHWGAIPSAGGCWSRQPTCTLFPCRTCALSTLCIAIKLPCRSSFCRLTATLGKPMCATVCIVHCNRHLQQAAAQLAMWLMHCSVLL